MSVIEPEISLQLKPDQIAQSRVVVVDDDELVTGSLRNFLELEMDIEPAVYNRSQDALAHLQEREVDLIISDFLMPNLNGIELLAQARELQPQVPRVLLTGYADKENAIRAINRVQLFQYLEKPWDNDQLAHVVHNALERTHLLRSLAKYVETLVSTRKDLDRLRKGLMRAFA